MINVLARFATLLIVVSASGYAADKLPDLDRHPPGNAITLVCRETAVSSAVVPAHSDIAIQAPPCDQGYTIVSGGCDSGNRAALSISTIDTNVNGFGCIFTSSSSSEETVSAYGHCCRAVIEPAHH